MNGNKINVVFYANSYHLIQARSIDGSSTQGVHLNPLNCTQSRPCGRISYGLREMVLQMMCLKCTMLRGHLQKQYCKLKGFLRLISQLVQCFFCSASLLSTIWVIFIKSTELILSESLCFCRLQVKSPPQDILLKLEREPIFIKIQFLSQKIKNRSSNRL